MKSFTEEFATKFKKSYSRKMGGSQTIVMPNGQRFFFDDREYYQGRGSKYNSSISHDDIGDVLVSKKQIAELRRLERERQVALKAIEKERSDREKRIKDAELQGLYLLVDKGGLSYVELSEEERTYKCFDVSRLAKTLGISESDANLLKSTGKTYVFAKSSDGNTYELYHSSLDCNYLSISVSIASEERIKEFKPGDWQNAPFAHLLGQTENSNHFVC